MRKGTWALREIVVPLGSLNPLERSSFPDLDLPSGQSPCFVPPWLICLRTVPWDVHAHPSQDRSRSEGFWEEHDSLWPGITFSLLTPRSLSTHGLVSPLSDRVFSFLCPGHNYALKVRDKDRLFILFLVGYKFLNGSPAVSDVKKCKEEAG